MNLLVIRHGIAENTEAFADTGEPDGRRPLTEEGRFKMRHAAAGLHRLVPEIALLATSPLARARQTAEIVRKEYGIAELREIDLLRPQTPFPPLVTWLREVDPGPDAVVAIFGHRPHLEELIGWLVTGAPDTVVRLKKGGAAMLAFSGRARAPRAGRAVLRWALTPAQLRLIAGAPTIAPADDRAKDSAGQGATKDDGRMGGRGARRGLRND